MSQILTGREAAKILLEKLGLPADRVIKVSLDFTHNNIFTLDLTMAVPKNEAESFFDELKVSYELQQQGELDGV